MFDTLLPRSCRSDTFHLVKLANSKLDECRRRVQAKTLGHHCHSNDPRYRCRRLITKADERLNDQIHTSSAARGLLEPAATRARSAWRQREAWCTGSTQPMIPTLAAQFVERLGVDLQDSEVPTRVRNSAARS